MKLAARETDGFLAAPHKVAGALVYGPDAGLAAQRSKRIAAAILDGADDAFNRVDLSEEQLLSDPARLADELASMSLMGGRRLIWIRDAGDKTGGILKDALTQLGDAIQSPQSLNYVLMTAGELTPRSPLRSLAETHKQLASLACYQEEAQALGSWVRSSVQQSGISCDGPALAFLTAHLKGDRMIAQGELERILLYFHGEKSINVETLKSLFVSDQESSLDDLSHAFAAGDLAMLMRMLDEALIIGLQPVVIIRSIDRMLGKLQALQSETASGKSIDDAVNSARPPIFFKDKPKYRAYLMRWQPEALKRVRGHCLRLELQLKTKHETADITLKDGLLRMASQARSKAAA